MALHLEPEDLSPVSPQGEHEAAMAVPSHDDATRVEELATGFPAEERRSPSFAGPLGLVAAVAVIALAVLLFRMGPGLQQVDDRPVADQMAAQRLADIRTEQTLADARADPWAPPGVIDAHVSAFHTVGPVR
jgi:hypothetical protein